MNRILPTVLITSLLLAGCGDSGSRYNFELVDRGEVFSGLDDANPLMLVIEIAEDGRLRLNRIDTGTLADLDELSERLRIIFDDREMTGIDERQVLIDPNGHIAQADLERLIAGLGRAKAGPILVIRDSF